jgi:hypothetical protein
MDAFPIQLFKEREREREREREEVHKGNYTRMLDEYLRL